MLRELAGLDLGDIEHGVCGCSPIWKRGSAKDCVCIFGGSGRTGPSASRNCAVEALRNSLPRLPPVRRRASGACQDTRHFRRHCAIPFSTLSACLASTLRVEAQPGRTAEVRDPYARWCGRGGVVRRPPIPIVGTERKSVRPRLACLESEVERTRIEAVSTG